MKAERDVNINGENIQAIKTASETLQNATYALSQQMYANSSNGGSTGPTYTDQTQDDVIEGEYTEA